MMVLLAICGSTNAKKLNFNAGWRLQVGDVKGALEPECDDRDWQAVTLPYAFNGSEAFKKDKQIAQAIASFTGRGGKVVYCCAGEKEAPAGATTSTSGDAVVKAVRNLFPTH